MIERIENRVASIIKALNETEVPVCTPTKKNKLNGLTRLNNEIVRLQVQDSLGLEFFKDIEGSAGYDD